MERRTFKTLIKGRHKLCDEYARARVSAMALEIIGNYSSNRLIFDEKLVDGKPIKETGNLIMTHECTKEEYAKFRDNVEVVYPGLCIFDYKR